MRIGGAPRSGAAGPGHVDRAAEDAAHGRYEQAEERRAAVERKLAAVQEARAEAAAAAGSPPPVNCSR